MGRRGVGRKCHDSSRFAAHFCPTPRARSGCSDNGPKQINLPKESAMKSTHAAARNVQTKGEDLDGRYGEIGISAVAAALPYTGDAKNPAYAPVVHREDLDRLE